RGRVVHPAAQRVLDVRGAEGVGGVDDRTVAGAPAEVSAQGVQVEAVRATFRAGAAAAALAAVGRRTVRWYSARGRSLISGRLISTWRRRACGTARPVVLAGHRADEAGGAVSALRPAAQGHLSLDRVQVGCSAQALGGDHLASG